MSLNITEKEFNNEVEQSNVPVVVDFWAPWCGPCKILGPVLDELSNEIADSAKVVKVNVDDNPELAGKFGIMSIPTMVFFKDGQPFDKLVGVHSKDVIKQKLIKG